jgi:hypothetical protein
VEESRSGSFCPKEISMTTSSTDRARSSQSVSHGGPTARRLTTETKSSFKTTEMVFYVLAVLGVLLASLLVKTTTGHDDYFRADKAWFYIVLLTIGYLGSRGLAKSGSRGVYDATNEHNDH